MSTAAFRRTVLRWGRRHRRDFPWREGRNPYAVLIGEVLLQRTRGEHVVPIYEAFLERWPTPSDLASARTPSVASVIRPLGLKKRAPVLKRLGRALSDLEAVPTEPADLIQLPGIGPYAAHAIPIFSTDRRLPLVDWVIARVLRRYFGMPEGKRPNADRELWRKASEIVEAGRARDLWLGTLDLAAEICTPRPKCPMCPLRLTCSYYLQKRGDVLPAP